MKKCIVFSDSFKGTLSSTEICTISTEEISKHFPKCDVIAIPAADGGEGTVDCFIKVLNAIPVETTVRGAYGEPRSAVYARLGDSAIIEMASAAGLPSVGNRLNPAITTTLGVGELILHAVEHGCREILLGLGGSATNDGGCGCASALGVRFTDTDGHPFVPVGNTLKNIYNIDISEARRNLSGVKLTVMSDVKNPLYGINGAAYVFGPQKGADIEMIEMLDDGLRNMGSAIKRCIGIDVADVPGAGAAGGMGAGILAYLGGDILSGIEAVLEFTSFDKHLEDASLVITGEGRLDKQSFQGKVLSGVSAHTRRKGVPLIAVVGCIADGAEEAYCHGVSAIFTTNRAGLPFEQLKSRAAADYRNTLCDIMQLIKLKSFL